MSIQLRGRIDSQNASDVEKQLFSQIGDSDEVILDAEKLEYISSAGLRVILGATQAMEGKGDMIVRNPSQAVREVFDLTGFSNLFHIE